MILGHIFCVCASVSVHGVLIEQNRFKLKLPNDNLMGCACNRGVLMKKIEACDRETAKNKTPVTFKKYKCAPIPNRVIKVRKNHVM